MTGEHTPPKRRQLSAARVLVVLGWVCSLGFVATGTWSSYQADLRNDQYQLINLGQCVYEGGRMYVDCWENKPPGLAWINAAGIAVGGGRQIGVWLLPGVTLLLCLIVMGWAMWRVLSPTASTAAVLLASIIATLRLYDTPSVNPDFYAAMFELMAGSVWLASLGTRGTGRRFGPALAAGILWAGATTVKQTGCVGLLAVSLMTLLLIVFRRSERGHWAWTGGLAWIGLAVGLGGVVLILVWRETLAAAWEAVFTFNHGLLTWSGLIQAATSWSRQRAGLEPVQLGLLLGLLGAATTLCGARANGVSPAVVIALVVWWMGQVLLALLGPSRSMRYWQATWPPMFWLAGVGLFHVEALFRQSERGRRAALSIMSAALLLLLGEPLVDHYKHGIATSYLAAGDDGTQRKRLEETGRRLREIVPEGQRIYVWAYDAGIYLFASRRPASRFTYPRSEGQIEEILADLAIGKAYAILIPRVTSSHFDRWCGEPCHKRLDDILTQYETAASIAPYQVWVRSDEDGRDEAAHRVDDRACGRLAGLIPSDVECCD